MFGFWGRVFDLAYRNICICPPTFCSAYKSFRRCVFPFACHYPIWSVLFRVCDVFVACVATPRSFPMGMCSSEIDFIGNTIEWYCLEQSIPASCFRRYGIRWLWWQRSWCVVPRGSWAGAYPLLSSCRLKTHFLELVFCWCACHSVGWDGNTWVWNVRFTWGGTVDLKLIMSLSCFFT